ncbi:MAG TPA: phenylalanine--tRNA ligase subunit alpha [Candidatus Aquilonibacter sp.]|nr:phenylalanine--tRNA ligase subunit alpha [Candidatus Aquilonibacter sp.]
MTTDPTTQTLAELGDTTAEKVAARFAEVRARFDQQVAVHSAGRDAEEWRVFVVAWTGRKSSVLVHVGDNWLKPAPKELKPIVGQELNKLKAHVEATLEEKRKEIEAAAEQAAAARDQIDLSLPGVERAIGTRHLIRQTFDELLRIFLSIGFSVVEGPEIETPYYNFEALNIPEHHPARDNMDTFYIEGSSAAADKRGTAVKHLLRTHTSPMQIRTMEKQAPPVRIVVPGKVYRRDNPDSTHGFMFHQIEGLAVDTDITFCDFKGTVEYFVREFLGPKAKTRLRPSYFPFTEPSAEVDATCHVCGGTGCRVCKFSGWIELFGAGMVNPAVYAFVGYDAAKLSGFAFGMGVDRLAMMKYGITELPLLFQNDVRFLRQFP